MSEQPSSSEKLAIYQRAGHIGTLTLNRPEKRNALSLGVWYALGEAIADAEKDSEARVILVKGAGKSFCAGLDLSPENQVVALLTGTPNATQKMKFYRVVKELQQIHTRLERLAQPTIGILQGHCLGAGLELALCCDIRLCSAQTLFALPEAALAIITDVGGLQRLARVVGRGHAREIAYRAHRFGSERALAINLVNYVYPDQDTLQAEAMKMAQEIAGNPPLAVQGAKDVFLFDEEASLEDSLDYTAARSSMIMPSEDLLEAMQAFMQKRKGEFKGA